jgi:hypothetical protein
VEDEQGVLAVADIDIGDAGGVYRMVDIETIHFWGFWGKQGGWDMFWGGSDGSGSVFHRF